VPKNLAWHSSCGLKLVYYPSLGGSGKQDALAPATRQHDIIKRYNSGKSASFQSDKVELRTISHEGTKQITFNLT
jgi:hypothetical protein